MRHEFRFAQGALFTMLVWASPQLARAQVPTCLGGQPSYGLGGNQCAFFTLEDARQAAAGGPLPHPDIYVRPGTHLEPVFEMPRTFGEQLTIRGAADCGCLAPAPSGTSYATIVFDNQASGSSGIVVGDSPLSATLSLNNIGIQATGPAQDGGLIWVRSGSSVGLVDTTLVYGEAMNRGGCIFAEENSLVALSGNTATLFCSSNFGGAIYLDGSTLVADGDSLIAYSDAFQGGAVFAGVESAILAGGNSVIGGSAASGDGGGIFLEASDLTLTDDARVSFSTASGDGGGVFVGPGSSVAITDSASVLDNVASSGGGLYLDTATLTLAASGSIDGNSADYGGGVAAVRSALDLTGGIVRDNTAEWGGGVDIKGNTDVDLSGGEVSGNTGASGGGIYIEGASSNVLLFGTYVHDNVADDGGGIFFQSGSLTTGGGTLIEANEALQGGGVYASRAWQSADDTEIRGNAASEKGGGIFFVESTTLDDAVLIVDNTADYGGGLATYTPIALNLAGDVVLQGNHANQKGGGIAVLAGATLDVSGNVEVSENTADSMGGGVYVDQASAAFIGGSSSISRNQAPSGGGIKGESTTTLTLQDEAVVEGNVAGSGGGIMSGSVTLLGKVRIQNNLATSSSGGGIYLSGSHSLSIAGDPWTRTSPDIEDVAGGVLIAGNAASVDGGGIYVAGAAGLAVVDATNVIFLENLALSGRGGALFADDSDALFRNSLVLANEALDGGGFYMLDSDLDFQAAFAGPSPCSVSNSGEWENHYCAEFSENKSQGGQGGALVVEGGGVSTVAKTSFWENDGWMNGAAIRLLENASGEDPQILVKNVLLARNHNSSLAAENQTISVEDGAKLQLSQSTMADALDVRYGPLSLGFVRRTIFWDTAGSGVLDLQTSLNGICNMGNLIGPSGISLTGADNDNGIDPEYDMSASNPTPNPRGFYHISGSTTAPDQCTTGSGVDLEGVARPDGVSGSPPGLLYDCGAFENPAP